MTPIQQLMLGVGAKKKTYLDDVYATYTYEGTGSSTTYNNGINLSEEGGLVWIKDRENSNEHMMYDTVRGVEKYLMADGASGQETSSNGLTSFNNNGFTLGGWGWTNAARKYGSWTFRKAPGFFDVVTYTGNGTNGRTVSHNLGCVPGMILIKNYGGTNNWVVYHRGADSTQPANYRLRLNTDISRQSGYFNNTEPTASVFTLGTDSEVNGNGDTYIAYVFAGGRSPAATAKSVEFDHNGDWLSCTHGSAGSSDFSVGTGDFTIECWMKMSDPSQYHAAFQIKDGTVSGAYSYSLAAVWRGNNQKWQMYGGGGGPESATDSKMREGQWYHIAMTRQSGVRKLWVDGVEKISQNDTTDYDHHGLVIGSAYDSSIELLGNISNFRFVNGTCLYTATFRPPTEPLTNITNTKLLCCQGSTTTSATVIPSGSSITATGNPVASSDSPFDDPAAFIFGDSGKESIITTGSYTGSGNSDGPFIELGWEPQFVILKNAGTGSRDWFMFDSHRGISTENDERLIINENNNASEGQYLETTATGFKIKSSDSVVNENDYRITYLAIRMNDGYVQKPIKTGTDAFVIDTGGGGTSPNWDTTFAVDMALKKTTGSSSWYLTTRNIEPNYLQTAATAAENGAYTQFSFDYSNGFGSNSDPASHLAYMWRRHKGFECVTYIGNSFGTAYSPSGITKHQIRHSLGVAPEMIWAKRRNAVSNWAVYHKGMNGGTNDNQYVSSLNLQNTKSDENWWGDVDPTSEYFTVSNNHSEVNNNDDEYVAMLFASSDVSKVGSYTGNGSTGQTITTGFQPRFLIIKRTSGSQNWLVLDTTNGWGSGNENFMKLNNSDALASHDFGAPTSTGFTLTSAGPGYNDTGENYIYYAHA